MPSPAGVTTGHLVGVGSMRDRTNKILFPGYQVISFDIDFAEVALEDGNYNLNNVYWALMQGFGGNVAWHKLNAIMVGAMLGGTVTDGGGIDSVVEEFTVPAAPAYTVTLANAVTCVDDSIVNGAVVLVDASGNEIPCKIVTGAPAASGEVQVAAGVLTFNVADAGLSGYCSYFFTDLVGRKVAVPPYALPGQIKAYLELMLYLGDQVLEPCIIEAERFVWTGGFSLAGPRAGHDPLSRDFRVNNKVPGDLNIWMR